MSSIYTILILSLKNRYVYQYVCSSVESVIEHIYKHLLEYHNYDINSDSKEKLIPTTIDAAKGLIKTVLGKEYYVSISEDEIDSFIKEEECTEEHDAGEN